MADIATTRSDVSPLIPEEVTYDILSTVRQDSFCLSNFRVKRVGRKQHRLPALSVFPQAYWVNGDAGLKATTTMKWDNRTIYIEEMAAIVIIDDATADDIDDGLSFWSEATPLIADAFKRKIDETILFGFDVPSNTNWPKAIIPDAIAHNMYVELGTATQANGGIATDISELMGKIEAVGYTPNIAGATVDFKKNLRNARDTTGQRLADVSLDGVHGLGVQYIGDGMWEDDTTNSPMLILGNKDEVIIGVRQEITYKTITEGVISDNDGRITINLPQQDSVALRCVMRLGWVMANRLNWKEQDAAVRYPFGVLVDQS